MKFPVMWIIFFVVILTACADDPKRYQWDTDENGSFCRDGQTGKRVEYGKCR